MRPNYVKQANLPQKPFETYFKYPFIQIEIDK